MRPTILRCLFTLVLLATAPLALSADSAVALRLEVPGHPAAILSWDDLAALPTAGVEARDHGRPGRWTGVPLHTLLVHAGAPLGDGMRGPALAQVVVVEAADGYRAAFALAEFDPALGAREAILATARDGAPLSAKEGPLRLVVPGERRQARWVRQVVAIRVVPAP